MNKKTGATLSITSILTLGLILACSTSAHADSKWNRGNDHHAQYEHHDRYDRYDRYGRHDRGDDRYQKRVVYYHTSYRPDYQVVYYRPWQPVPVVSHYRVGDYLPSHVRCYDPPRSVVAVLPPVHRGTRYVQVDQNVYLVSEASKKILDAVVLFSGVR